MKKLIIILITVACCLLPTVNCVGQQDALYSQYMFNPLVLNPAYAGSREALSMVLLHRSQWWGFKGAPSTQTFSVHTPLIIGTKSDKRKRSRALESKKIGVGLNLINDNIGPGNSFGIFGSGAYRLSIGKGKLSMGLKAGFFKYEINWNEIDYPDKTTSYTGNKDTKILPSFDFGLYYYTDMFYAGAALTHLSRPSIAVDSANNKIDGYLSRHFILTSGYAFMVNEFIIFKPSFLMKYVKSAPLSVDINANFLFYGKLWVGTSFRWKNGIVFLTEFNFTDQLKAGYAFDLTLNPIRKHSKGSHEIFISADLNLWKTKVKCPRFF
ncbi:MAG: type IX secretion system membrane protein PorP/SprF [Bacteroidetes bacterium]|nr:type IX secretion system membrane protein PorP/SprF [Bacteroidota bacterium]